MAQLLYTLGVIAGLGAAVVAIPRIWQAIVWTYRLLHRVDEISRLGPTIVGMAQQFQRNGGSSMRDAVAAIKEDVAGVKTDVAALKTQTNQQDNVLEGIVAEQAEFKKELARLIYHEANGDLHKSKLREEAERMLGKPDAPPVDEGPQG